MTTYHMVMATALLMLSAVAHVQAATLSSQDEVTTERRESEGTYQLIGWDETHTLSSQTPNGVPYVNGEGDSIGRYDGGLAKAVIPR